MQKELRQNRHYIRVHKITYVFVGSPREKMSVFITNFVSVLRKVCPNFARHVRED